MPPESRYHHQQPPNARSPVPHATSIGQYSLSLIARVQTHSEAARSNTTLSNDEHLPLSQILAVPRGQRGREHIRDRARAVVEASTCPTRKPPVPRSTSGRIRSP